MFGRRPDGTQVRELSAMRRFMPYVSPRRNDSVFHLAQDMDVEAAFEFLEKKNRERPPERPITLFHLFLRSGSQALHLRPGVNRFVKGGKLWQRHGEWLTFGAKVRIEDGAPLVTIKRKFEPTTESLDEMVDGIYGLIRPARAGKKSTSDKEMGLMLRLPGFVIRAALWLLRVADHFGAVPRAMIDADPLYTSCFVANLGSVGHDAGFHHLWEYGTCSLFGVMGKIKRGPDGRRFMTVCWTYDERIEDGLYSYIVLAGIKDRIEHPELLELSTLELERR
jgi:pyruvate/2-oxoglutarate dehydrogenase complex dihydrolipoamide acyltransferase (E2) component